MDARLTVGLGTFVLPAALIGVTVWKFSSNPLAVLALLAVMLVGGFYLLSYTGSE